MKRFIIWLSSLSLFAGLIVAATQVPSYADVKSACTSNGAVCMDVGIIKDPGTTGIRVDFINLWCDADHWAFGWDHPAVDGHSLRIKNLTTGGVPWSVGDASSNVDVDNGSCTRIINLDVYMPQAHSINVKWDFTEQINLQSDINDSLSITITNG